jgi:hypothetical protein
MKAFGVAFAFILGGAATAAELSYEAPPSEQVFTPVSAVDWTGLVPFRTSGWLGGLQAGYIQNGQIVNAAEGDIDLAGIQVEAGGAAAETLAGDATKRGIQDRTGRTTLGVDISHAGSTPTKVRRFLVRLPADAASKVRDGCATVMVD